MDALEVIREQHDEVDRLFAKIEQSEDLTEKAELFTELGNKIAAHSRMEQELFYPAANTKQTHELLVRFTEEHLSVYRILADLLELEPSDERFAAKLAVMKEQFVLHSRQEEEAVLMPQVEKVMTPEERDRLGDEMLARYDKVLLEGPGQQVPEETEHAAPV